MKATRLSRLFLACVAAALLSACAGSAADNDFRSKVQELDVTGTGGATADGAVTAGAGAKFTFRDPGTLAPTPTPTVKPAVK